MNNRYFTMIGIKNYTNKRFINKEIIKVRLKLKNTDIIESHGENNQYYKEKKEISSNFVLFIIVFNT